MKYIITERQYRLLSEQEEEILTIPYAHFDGDWDMLQVFLERRKNPPYKISGDLNLAGSSIKSLGNLESVGGGLYLQGSPIKSLGNLKSVGGTLNLRDSSIKSLGNLESVGGYLDLRGTPISKKYTEDDIRSMVNVGGEIIL
jgi:hypothetical protein